MDRVGWQHLRKSRAVRCHWRDHGLERTVAFHHLESSGVEPLLITPEQMATMIRAQVAELQTLITAANIKMD